MVGYIYCITGPTGRYYGLTRYTPEHRFRAHVISARGNGKRKCTRLANAINKYGESNFLLETLEIHYSEEDLLSAESWWIATARTRGETLYNLRSGGEMPKHSPETRNKIATSRLGIEPWNKGKKTGKRAPFSDEWRKNMSEGLRRGWQKRKAKSLPA